MTTNILTSYKFLLKNAISHKLNEYDRRGEERKHQFHSASYSKIQLAMANICDG